MREPTLEDISHWFRRSAESGLVGPDDDVVVFYDLAVQADRRRRVRACFPASWRHTLALKTNPLPALVAPAVSDGFGVEVASLGELAVARLAGGAPLAVWNSPAKSPREVRAATDLVRPESLLVNFDSLAELGLLPHLRAPAAAGLRINPLVGPVGPEGMSTATQESKFGEPITNRAGIVDAFVATPRLRALHAHSGSHAVDHAPLVEGVARLVGLARDIAARTGTVPSIDIGGGLAVDYSGARPVLVEEYARDLLAACPELGDGEVEVVTEFGRYYHAHAGVVVSRVAQVKRRPGARTIIHHAGADLFLREAYQPGAWPHRLAVLGPGGEAGGGLESTADVAGPLCFGGDFLLRGAAVGDVAPGDWLVVRDAGANSFSLWSHHCSRPFPSVIAVDGDRPDDPPRLVRRRQSIDDITSFWTGGGSAIG